MALIAKGSMGPKPVQREREALLCGIVHGKASMPFAKPDWSDGRCGREGTGGKTGWEQEKKRNICVTFYALGFCQRTASASRRRTRPPRRLPPE